MRDGLSIAHMRRRRQLKCFGKSGLFEDRVGRVSRQNLGVDGEIFLGDPAEPDFMIAFSMTEETTARISKQLL